MSLFEKAPNITHLSGTAADLSTQIYVGSFDQLASNVDSDLAIVPVVP